MTGPERRQPPTFASAMRVFDLWLEQMLWSRRSVFLALLVGAPVVMAAALRAASILHPFGLFTFRPGPGVLPRPPGAQIYGMMVYLMYVRFIVPVLGVFYGTSLVADEVDDKTITYLFTRPIRRRAVVLGKYFGYLVCTILLVLPSALLVFFLVVPIGGEGTIAANFPALMADLGMLVLGLATYGAVFAFVGARLKRPLVAGLVFAFGWEPAALLIPGYLKRASVAYYLQALVAHDLPANRGPVSALLRVVNDAPSVAVGLAGLICLLGLGLWAAGRAVEQREYVLEQ